MALGLVRAPQHRAQKVASHERLEAPLSSETAYPLKPFVRAHVNVRVVCRARSLSARTGRGLWCAALPLVVRAFAALLQRCEQLQIA